MTRLVVIGAGGHGKVVADAAQCTKFWDDIVFVDKEYPEKQICGSWDILARGLDDAVVDKDSDQFVVAVGDNHTRAQIFERAVAEGYKPACVIHPSAIVSDYSSVGSGTVVLAGAVINHDSQIGCCAIINTGAMIDHDCAIEDFCHVSPGASIAGGVVIGRFSWIGTGVSTKQAVNITRHVVVGVGAAVVCDLVEAGTYIGVPAKRISTDY